MDTPFHSSVPPRAPLTTSVGIIIVLSLIFGGLGGGFITYFLTGTSTGKTIVNTSTTTGLKTVSVQEQSATIDVVKKANPAVVSIIASKDYSQIYGNQPLSPFDQFFFGTQQATPQTGSQVVSSGSGFIVQADGLIVTNQHVVSDTQASYAVVMNDGKKYDATVLARDTVNDIALVKIKATGLPILTLGNSDTVQIGQSVVAIGNALGQYRNTVTQGVISGESRTITAGDGSTGSSETLDNVFQTDASINPGNSGGPLLDLSGSVIAMNTAIDQQGTLIGFAIPINTVKKDVNSVISSGKIVQPYLGVRYTIVTQSLADQNKLPVNHGAWVQAGTAATDSAVVSGSPADKAGLKANDIITSVNGTDITVDTTLTTLLQKYSPGDQLKLVVYRGTSKINITVTVGEHP